MDNQTKDTNPKDSVGSEKVPLHLWPEIATIHGCLALLDGALKYGRANWRHDGARASIYYDACKRHLDKWFEGCDPDPDSGLKHLAHALASIAIILDAEAQGVLVDDRQYYNPGAASFETRMNVANNEVRRLKEKYKDRKPRHWSINDVDKSR